MNSGTLPIILLSLLVSCSPSPDASPELTPGVVSLPPQWTRTPSLSQSLPNMSSVPPDQELSPTLELVPPGVSLEPSITPSLFHVASATAARAAFESSTVQWLNRIMTAQHTLSLEENEPLLWGSGWCASSQEILDQNYTVMETRLFVNSFQIDPAYYSSRDYGSDDPANPTYCRSFYVLIDSWPEGYTCLDVRHAILEPLSDGWQEYPKRLITSQFCVTVHLQ